mmetsp:Transcript_17247/g.33855  ORF Transcript_17247/g.33855 Transcript_17247/m.33855 type:complete len:994 (+) Transcript_17247:432-3413(+)|eukprot:CAMPEP_0171503686 /NCGR_PEP_ID=MMETSP0958-20121227/11058_1 /TAXON_ID=87120 /ORGANISM="Aurantiochytrium limacinum, Strain ATCCMYA-1381" /LENGTH=993 /DNA_ID=CAMNT_0012039253 /DNA_START=346 /DNA_END=3327 /DNA_ORIENTATION=+
MGHGPSHGHGLHGLSKLTHHHHHHHSSRDNHNHGGNGSNSTSTQDLPASLAKKFSHAELDMLRKCYKDLAQRSPGKSIDKDTFSKFFPLPGLHGERLFYVFDRKHTGHVEFAEFVAGLALCLRGSFDEKVRVIFRIYDIDNNDHVSKDELKTMLLQVPRESLYKLSAKIVEEGLRERLLTDRHIERTDSLARIASQSGSSNDVASDVVNQLVDSAFSTFDLNKDAYLSSEQFSRWVRSTPEVLDFLSTVFPLEEVTKVQMSMNQHATDIDDSASEHSDDSPSYPRRTSSPFANMRTPSPGPGSQRSSSQRELKQGRPRLSIFGMRHHHHHFSSTPSVPRSQSAMSEATDPDAGCDSWEQTTKEATKQVSGAEQSGMLYKVGRRMKGLRVRMFILRGSVLYYYYPHKYDQPAGIVFLQGCFVAPRDSNVRSAPSSPRGSRRASSHQNFESSSNGTDSTDAAEAVIKPRKKHNNQHHNTEDAHHSKHCTGELQRKLRSEFSETSIQMKHTTPADMEIFSPPVSGAGARMFPFEIITSQGGERDSRLLYAKTAAERDAWVAAIKKASNVVPFSARYNQLERIGRGKFAVVYKCERIGVNDGKPEEEKEYCAVKIIDKASLNEKEKELLRTEIAVLKLVNHPNIIKLHDTFESLNHIYLVMELVQGGELFDRIVGRARLKEHEVYPILFQLAEAVRYLHMLGVAHRDIKPENILCSGNKDDPITTATLKICDFGLSKLVSPLGVMKLACGTLSYVAPEVLTAQGYGKAADIWNIGVIIYLVRRGRLPFDGESKDEIIYNTIHLDLDFARDPVFSKSSPDHVDLIKGLLRKNPEHRLTAEQVLRHPWMLRMKKVWEEELGLVPPVSEEFQGAAEYHAASTSRPAPLAPIPTKCETDSEPKSAPVLRTAPMGKTAPIGQALERHEARHQDILRVKFASATKDQYPYNDGDTEDGGDDEDDEFSLISDAIDGVEQKHSSTPLVLDSAQEAEVSQQLAAKP